MMMRSAIAIAVAFVAGCANSLHVEVSKVEGVSSLQPNSALGRSLDEAIASLDTLEGNCNRVVLLLRAWADESTRAALAQDHAAGTTEKPAGGDAGKAASAEETPAGQPGQQGQADYRRRIPSWEGRYLAVATEAHKLAEETTKFFEGGDISRKASTARAQVRKVRAFFVKAANSFEEWRAKAENVRSLEDIAKRLGTADAFRAVQQAEVEALATATFGEPKAPLRFGGFTATDVYEINPSDPAYENVFNSRTFESPLTMVSTSVSGDSAIMIVIEHAGQARVYQVSNDPVQLTRNIGFLVSKASAAVARFGAAGATGGASEIVPLAAGK